MRSLSLGAPFGPAIGVFLGVVLLAPLAWSHPEDPATDTWPEASLLVRVLADEDARPLAGAKVVLHDAAHLPFREGTTDAAGEVRWTLPAGSYGAVSARLPGRALGRISVFLQRGEAGERILRLVPAAPRRGHVLDAVTDQPVVGARVLLRFVSFQSGPFSEGWWDLEEAGDEVKTDAEGAFTLVEFPALPEETDLEPHAYPSLEVSAPGFATAALLLGGPREARADLVMRLPRGASIEGFVRETDGAPSRHADVEVALAAHPWMLDSTGGAPGTGDGWVDSALTERSGSWATFVPTLAPSVLPFHPIRRLRTDAAGRFLASDLAAGASYVVRAERGFGGTSRIVTATTPADGGRVVADLELRSDAAVTVTVRDASWEVRAGLPWLGTASRPVPEARVLVRAWGDDLPIAEGTTDPEGRVTFEHLPCGRLEVSVDGHEPSSDRLDLGPGDHARVAFHKWPAGALRWIRGRITDDLGRPLAGAELFSGGGYRTTADADGRYALEGPDVAGAWLYVQVPAGKPAKRWREVTLPRGTIEAMNVVMPRLAQVTLAVERPAGDFALEPPICLSSDGDEPIYVGAGWIDGARRMEKTFACDPSARRIKVDAPPFLPLVFDVVLTPGAEVSLPARTLVPGVTLEGRLLHADGQPVGAEQIPLFGSPYATDLREVVVYQPGAWAEARVEGAPLRGAPGDDGRFHISGLRPGPATLVVQVRYEEMLRQEIEIRPDAEALEVRIPAMAALSLRVRDAAGRPVPRATVRLGSRLVPLEPRRGPERWTREAPADLSGRLDLEIPPGPYRLEVRRETTEPAAEPNAEAKPTSRELDLPPGARLPLEVVLE